MKWYIFCMSHSRTTSNTLIYTQQEHAKPPPSTTPPTQIHHWTPPAAPHTTSSATPLCHIRNQAPPATLPTHIHNQKPPATPPENIALKATEATHPSRRSWLHLACNHSKFHGLATSPLQACLLAARKYTIFFWSGGWLCWSKGNIDGHI